MTGWTGEHVNTEESGRVRYDVMFEQTNPELLVAMVN